MPEKLTLEDIENKIRQFCNDNLISLPEGQSPISVIRQPNRQQEFVKIKQFLIKIFRDELGWSFPRIGRFLNKDHTSIIHLYYKK